MQNKNIKLDIYVSDSCGACKMMHSTFEILKLKYQVVLINTSEELSRKKAITNGVKALPTIAINIASKSKHLVGFMPLNSVEEGIAKFVKSSAKNLGR